jgi:hypothetical protein
MEMRRVTKSPSLSGMPTETHTRCKFRCAPIRARRLWKDVHPMFRRESSPVGRRQRPLGLPLTERCPLIA